MKRLWLLSHYNDYGRDQHLEKYSLKTPFIIYADTKSILAKIHTCDKNPENLPQQKSADIKRVANNYSHTIC